MANHQKIEWKEFNNGIDIPTPHYKLTHQVSTIGPASQSTEKMSEMMHAGLNVVRLNFSHGDYAYHQKTVENARAAMKKLSEDLKIPGLCQAIALDIRGPKIRTGIVPGNNAEISFKAGQKITVTVDDKYKENCSSEFVYVDYKNLPKFTGPGKTIFIEDGLYRFKVDAVEGENIRCTVLNGGSFGSRKGVNLPNTDCDLPAISDKDKSDLEFGCKVGVDIIFASFIRDAAGVKEIREHLKAHGGEGIGIFSKIESLQGITNIDEIIKESDGIMVARGDMGIECDRPLVPCFKRMILDKCRMANKPVIVATMMLESMIQQPIPTRAEDEDVQSAVLGGADAVMLSGESAKGKYPVEAVREQSTDCRYAERMMSVMKGYFPYLCELFKDSKDPLMKQAMGIVRKARDQKLAGIVVHVKDGMLTKRVSLLRPTVPIIALCSNDKVSRSLVMFFGVSRIKFGDGGSAKEIAASFAKAIGHVKGGSKWVEVNEANPDQQNILSIG